MSFSNGFFMGGGFFSSPLSYPASSNYNSIKINGESTIDKVRLLNIELSDAELDLLTVTDVYTWDADTLLYAEFTNDLSGGFIYISEPIESWTVIRTIDGTTTNKIISSDLDPTTSAVYDYSGVKDVEYYYRIYPITASYVLAPLTTNTVVVEYCKVILIDEITGESYLFDLNLETGSTDTLKGRQEYSTGYAIYPTVTRDTKLYRQGSVNCLMGYMDSTTGLYVDTVAYLDDLEAFINNGHVKILKDRKGVVLKVDTFGFSHKIDQKIAGNPTTISFSYTQIGSV